MGNDSRLRLAIAALSCAAVVAVLAAPAHATFSGTNGRVAFLSFQSGGGDPHLGDSEIWSVFPDGSSSKQLTKNGGDDSSPSYSADGTKIVWIHNGAVWKMHSDGTSKKQLTNSPSRGPSWSPGGNRIIYIKQQFEIWKMHRDGSGKTKIFDSPNNRIEGPQFSPGGSLIVFSRLFDALGDWDLYTINKDGTSFTPIQTSNISERHADWSPIGGELLYERNHQDVYLLDLADLGSPHLITNGCGYDRDPVFAPDGSDFAWSCGSDLSHSDIYVADLATPGSFTNLTNDTNIIDLEPAWQSR